MRVSDASGIKRYLSIFQDKFKYLQENQVAEFRSVTVGRNGTSLSVGWKSTCYLVENEGVKAIFKDFQTHDAIITGVIDSFQGLSSFQSCSNCQGSVHEFDVVCKNCKKVAPTGEETFR